MIRTLTINNYRGFKHFEMKDLGRVNLLVGENNSGKTSILEAIEILTSPGNVGALAAANYRRGEYVFFGEENRTRREADICHLFHGHVIAIDTHFELKATDDNISRQFKATIDNLSELIDMKLFNENASDYDETEEALGISLAWSDLEENPIIPLSFNGGLSKKFRSGQASDKPLTRFISSSALNANETLSLFQEIALEPDEERIVETLRLIEPTIERIAIIASGLPRYIGSTSNGLALRLKDIKTRVPIGSMGDGIWRLLGITLALIRSKNSILLIDEIDTGLHYSVMEKMWLMVSETAKRLNVQVFATTHSRDCYESLAAVAQENSADSNELTIQRIECNKEQAVAYSEQEIIMAAKHGTEVR